MILGVKLQLKKLQRNKPEKIVQVSLLLFSNLAILGILDSFPLLLLTISFLFYIFVAHVKEMRHTADVIVHK